ncbi:protein neuralized-like [Asterias rubens]|uniref:protein neuralized-like n=1 Tax=Asterias rubens TaxID=7604 RepID=UPI0014551FEF|nr:protein neuralized-like [Asterias rubens]
MGQTSSSVSNSNHGNRAHSSTAGTSQQASSRSRPDSAPERRRTTSTSASSSGYRAKPNRTYRGTTQQPGRASWPHDVLQPLDSMLQPAVSQHHSDFHFHTIHGKNIVLSADHKTASRMGSFCNALVFTHRAIHIGEILHFELIQNTAGWSGVLRFGYTSQDPFSMRSNGIPKYACPDLTGRAGNWAKALRENCAKHGNVLNFVLSEDGTVYYSVNQEPFMEFFNGVDTSRPVWGVIDVYGNTTGVRIVDTFPTSNRISTRGASSVSGFLDPLRLVSDLVPGSGGSSSQEVPFQGSSGTRTNALKPDPLPLHSQHGCNIVLEEERFVAERKATTVSGGLVFTSRPIQFNEKIMVKVMTVNHCYIGHMGVGLTSCDPESLDPDTLPLEAEDVCDRKEYWVMTRDYDTLEEGASLGFTIDEDGRIHMTGPEGASDKVLMHVDTSTPLWMFFDLYGTTQTIKILGALKNSPPPPVPSQTDWDATNDINVSIFDEAEGAAAFALHVEDLEKVPTPPPRLHSMSAASKAKPSEGGSSQGKSRRQAPPRPNKPPLRQDNECTVCFENLPDAVFYRCGHICCCLACGVKLKERGDPCPLCRAPIHDIIKFYKT